MKDLSQHNPVASVASTTQTHKESKCVVPCGVGVVDAEGGWLKLYRHICQWEWFNDEKMLRLWLFLLCHASFSEFQYCGRTILPGQLVVTVKELCGTLGYTTKQVRTILARLEKTGEITMQGANKFSVVTICKWDSYQGKLPKKSAKRANKGQTKSAKKGKQNQHLNANESIVCDAPTQQKGQTKKPKKGKQNPSPIIYNNNYISSIKKNNNNNNGVADAFRAEVMQSSIKAEQVCKTLGIDLTTFHQLAHQCMDEWQVTATTSEAWSWAHLVNHIRIKLVKQSVKDKTQAWRQSMLAGAMRDLATIKQQAK